MELMANGGNIKQVFYDRKKFMCHLKIFLFPFCLFLGSVSVAQVKPDTGQFSKQNVVFDSCPRKDIFDIFWKKLNNRPRSDRRLAIIGFPYIGYTPATGFIFGIGGTISRRMGDPQLTNLSAAKVDAAFTTYNQLMLQVKSNIYTVHDDWFFQGEWRFYLFTLPTYGLGTMRGNEVPALLGFPKDTEGYINSRYPMTYKWFEFHQFVSRKVMNNFYAGLGYQMDYHTDVHESELQTEPPDLDLTPNYAYSILHGFNPDHYTSSGLSINCVYDTRDNIINPYKGFFVHLNYRYNFTWLGSSRQGSQLWTQFRTYITLSKRLPRHLIAFWVYGSFLISGEIPYLDLPTTGFDQMNTSGRGYSQGRWRGENFIYGEIEYRFPISQCSQILGGVLFFNATTASSKDLNILLFGGIRSAGGAGLRIMLSKRDRVNLLLDFAIGYKSNGAYVLTQEAF